MTDVKLTREQIEMLRRALHISWPNTPKSADALCDLALRGLDDAEDAERYRWLRDECDAVSNPNDTWILEAPADMWDDGIDAARKESHD